MVAVFAAPAAMLLSLNVYAQCQSAYTFAVCPEFDTIYVENCIRDPLALAAFRLSTGGLKWQAPVPEGTQFQCDLAATADVVASSAAPEREKVGDDGDDLVQEWDARTGKLLWVNGSGRTYGLVSAGPY